MSWPLHGMREKPWDDMCGWVLWVGDALPVTEDEWETLHVSHAGDWFPGIDPYLALPTGWRFVLAPGYEDVWFDSELLTDNA